MQSGVTLDGLVIHRADWRDYDRMLTLFTPENGRVDAVARGCRRLKSPLMNAAEPFCLGEYQLAQIKGKYTVVQCRVYDGYYPLREDYTRLTHGAYWLHLLGEVIVPGERYTELFGVTIRALAYLANSGIDPRLLTAMFEMQFWRHLGFSPNMSQCVACGRPHTEVELGFDALRGGAACFKCAPGALGLTENARRILQKAPRTPYDAVEKLAPREEWPEAARMIRAFTFARLSKQLPGAPEI